MSLLVPPKSPLRSHQANLKPRLRVVLDGMRYSVEMAELACNRLLATLTDVANVGPESMSKDDPRVDWAFTSALCDAWTIVDAVNRLRALTYAVPGGEKADYVREFRENTDVVHKLRNDVQHLMERVDKIASNDDPAWGTIAWVTVDALPMTEGQIHLLLPGSMRAGIFPFPNPSGEIFQGLLELVTLHAHGTSLRLLDVMRHVATFIGKFRAALDAQFKDQPRAGGDMYIYAKWVPGKVVAASPATTMDPPASA